MEHINRGVDEQVAHIVYVEMASDGTPLLTNSVKEIPSTTSQDDDIRITVLETNISIPPLPPAQPAINLETPLKCPDSPRHDSRTPGCGHRDPDRGQDGLGIQICKSRTLDRGSSRASMLASVKGSSSYIWVRMMVVVSTRESKFISSIESYSLPIGSSGHYHLLFFAAFPISTLPLVDSPHLADPGTAAVSRSTR